MIEKIISLILSIIIACAGVGVGSITPAFNNIYSLNFERADFLEDLGDDDICPISQNSGYVKNLMLLFFEDEASVFEKLGFLISLDGTVIGSLPDANLCVIATSEKDFEELNLLCEKAEEDAAVALASICPARKYQEQYTPNDPFLSSDWSPLVWNEATPRGYNWHLEAVDARGAWGYNEYFEHINIGIIDSGFMTDHEDLAGKIVFPSKYDEKKNEVKTHGTAVASIIGGIGDNGKGVCGICQNSTLIGINWDTGWISGVSIFFSFGKVVKAGAKVVNMSVGSSGALDDDEWYWMNFLNDMEGMIYSRYMGSLLKKGYDFVVVQSSGNGNGTGNPVDVGQNGVFCCVNEKTVNAPLGIDKNEILERIIIVGACYYEDGKFIQSSYSNVGKDVDIVAPGDNITIAYTGGYTYTSGTSFSTPIVSGIAALVWSVNENLSGKDVRNIVCQNTKFTAEPNEYYKFKEHLEIKMLPVVNAQLAVEAALKTRFDMTEILLENKPRTEIVFTNNSNGQELIFETDSKGMLSCLLEKGEYTVKTQSEILSEEYTVN